LLSFAGKTGQGLGPHPPSRALVGVVGGHRNGEPPLAGEDNEHGGRSALCRTASAMRSAAHVG